MALKSVLLVWVPSEERMVERETGDGKGCRMSLHRREVKGQSGWERGAYQLHLRKCRRARATRRHQLALFFSHHLSYLDALPIHLLEYRPCRMAYAGRLVH